MGKKYLQIPNVGVHGGVNERVNRDPALPGNKQQLTLVVPLGASKRCASIQRVLALLKRGLLETGTKTLDQGSIGWNRAYNANHPNNHLHSSATTYLSVRPCHSRPALVASPYIHPSTKQRPTNKKAAPFPPTPLPSGEGRRTAGERHPART